MPVSDARLLSLKAYVKGLALEKLVFELNRAGAVPLGPDIGAASSRLVSTLLSLFEGVQGTGHVGSLSDALAAIAEVESCLRQVCRARPMTVDQVSETLVVLSDIRAAMMELRSHVAVDISTSEASSDSPLLKSPK